jgi:single-strand DNA-binding protein
MSVNKVILVGNLGSDPEMATTNSGTKIASVSLATTKKWNDKEGKKHEDTEWHRLKFFGRLAEVVTEYTKKGSKLYAEGSLKTSKWTDKQGVERYTTEVMVTDIQMLDSKESKPVQAVSSVQKGSVSFDDMDSEVPF